MMGPTDTTSADTLARATATFHELCIIALASRSDILPSPVLTIAVKLLAFAVMLTLTSSVETVR